MLIVVKTDKIVASREVLNFNSKRMFIQKVLFDLHFITDNIMQRDFCFSEIYIVNFDVNVFVSRWIGIDLNRLRKIIAFWPAKIQVRLGLSSQSHRKRGQKDS